MIVQQWMAKAERTLTTARRILASDPDSACSSAYYAMFYAARAALLQDGQAERAMSKTHRGVIGAFGEHLVKPGVIAAEHGRAISEAQQDRLDADYTQDGVSAETARTNIDRAAALVTAVRDSIAAQGK